MTRSLFFIIAAICFGLNSFPITKNKFNLDAMGKCLFVVGLLYP